MGGCPLTPCFLRATRVPERKIKLGWVCTCYDERLLCKLVMVIGTLALDDLRVRELMCTARHAALFTVRGRLEERGKRANTLLHGCRCLQATGWDQEQPTGLTLASSPPLDRVDRCRRDVIATYVWRK